MAQIEPIGKSDCGNCATAVQVCINGNGYAYYRCAECGFEGRHHWHTTSKKFITARVKLHPVEGEKSEEKTAAKPTPKAVEKPEAPPAAPAAIVARKAGESLGEWMERKKGVSHAN